MEIVVAFFLGFGIGSIIINILYSVQRTHGTLRIDHSNPEKDIYRFDVDEEDLAKLSSKSRVTFKIDNNARLR